MLRHDPAFRGVKDGMLNLCGIPENANCLQLRHGGGVFHEALAHVIQGERHFCVTDEKGRALYGLAYVENQSWAEASDRYVHSKLFEEMPLYPPYLTYDEDCKERLCLDLFKDYDSVWFERANEYSVVLTRILLAYTDKTVFYADARMQWFLPGWESAPAPKSPAFTNATGMRLVQRDQAPEGALRVFGDFIPSSFDGDFTRLDAMVLFHHVFFFQWLTPLNPADVKYVEFVVPRTEGIGSILLAYGRGVAFFGALGMKVTLKPGCTRYPDEMLCKYVKLPFTPEDADDTNTIRVVNYYSVMYVKMLRRKGKLDLSILQPPFLEEMKTYADAVIRDRRMLGVLLRGSDYITSAMGGFSRPRQVAEVAPMIQKWFEEGGYDKIFLATEDGDLLDDMVKFFKGNVICVSQERYRVSDFREGMTTISELDRARHPGRAYDAYVEDATVNYLYAIYMLSRCEAFMYSCHCGGVSLARQFNGDQYQKLYSFADAGKEQ